MFYRKIAEWLCLFGILQVFTISTQLRSEVLRVGPGKPLTVPSEAAAVANNGDVIEIDAGLYVGDVAVWTQNDLTIRGINGRAHLEANGNNALGKGIWVIQGNNTTVENIEFSGATVPDENGAGIRQEGAGLTVRNCYFHDNENGILGPDDGGDVLIEYSEFANNGFGDGFTHNMYILDAKSFTLRFNYIHHARIGHNVKSRAQENYILYNRIMDERTGTSSYAIDLPNGGRSFIIGNLIQQGPDNDNSTIISYGAEGLSNPSSDLYIVNNTVVNDYGSGTFVFVQSGTTTARLINNLFVGPGNVLDGPGNQINNLATSNANLVDVGNYDYRLTESSPAIDAGIAPGAANDYDLTPTFQYVHPSQSEIRSAVGPIDIGAYEYNNVATSVNLFAFTIRSDDNRVILSWSTAGEAGNLGFEIERRTGEQDFAKIGFVRSEDANTRAQSYTFVDESVKAPAKYTYRIKQIEVDGTFNYSRELTIQLEAPNRFQLLGNYPNPFNPTTAIAFEIPFRSKVTLSVFNLKGELIRNLLVDEVKEAGRYAVPFNGSQTSSGLYFYRLSVNSNESQFGRMLLIK